MKFSLRSEDMTGTDDRTLGTFIIILPFTHIHYCSQRHELCKTVCIEELRGKVFL